jgi:hypothetical protein
VLIASGSRVKSRSGTRWGLPHARGRGRGGAGSPGGTTLPGGSRRSSSPLDGASPAIPKCPLPGGSIGDGLAAGARPLASDCFGVLGDARREQVHMATADAGASAAQEARTKRVPWRWNLPLGRRGAGSRGLHDSGRLGLLPHDRARSRTTAGARTGWQGLRRSAATLLRGRALEHADRS